MPPVDVPLLLITPEAQAKIAAAAKSAGYGSPRQADICRSTAEFCAPRVSPGSIYALLQRECFSLFPDALFADLFTDLGRRSI